MSNLRQDSCGCAVHYTPTVQNISDFQVKSQIVTKTAEEPQTPTGTSDCCWDVHSCVYTLSIVLELPAHAALQE